MKIKRLLNAILLLGLLTGIAGTRLCAQQSSGAAQAQTEAARAERMDAPETDPQIEQYRHSTVVQAIARYAHVRTETAAQIFEDFNSAILLVAILAFLWKALPKIFRNRTENLQRDLAGARQATEDANRRLAEVEARLLRLDTEIDAIRQQVEREAVEDEKRIRATLDTERERIIASAEQGISAAQAAAQRELKKFAADLAIDQAMHRIQISAEADRELIRELGSGLKNGSGGEA